MKSYTDLNQSRKLAEILPLESADMRFCFSHTLSGRTIGHYPMIGREPSLGTIPCWSLAALLSVLPNYQLQTQDDGIGILCSCNGKFNIITADNPVDTCYEMILQLKKNALI